MPEAIAPIRTASLLRTARRAIVFLLIPLLALWLTVIDSIVVFGSPGSRAAIPAGDTLKKDSLVTITLSFTGDLMCHSPQFNDARQPDGSYDFNPCWEELKPYLSAADFTMGNLETTCAGAAKGFSGYPAFNSPDEYIPALKNAGFDMLGTSNNHSMDTGEEGLQRTISILKKNGMSYTGTFTSQQDRDSVRIVNIKGMKLGILNYTYGTNGAYPSADHKYMLNVYDSTLVKNDVAAARKQGAELVLVFYHWGVEYRPDPMWPKQDTMMRTTIAAGADLIIGSHPHVIGPVTYYKGNGAKLDSGLVAWTMGNFLSNQSGRYKDAGLILNVELTKNLANDSVWISKTTFVPTWVYRSYSETKNQYIVLPAQWSERDTLPDWIDANSKRMMKEAFEDTKAMVRKYSTNPEVVK